MASWSNYQSNWSCFVLDDGRHKRCHQNQLKFREASEMEVDIYYDIPAVSSDTEAVPGVVPAANTGTTTEATR